eukprot:2271871-Amphidinium_carterae.1
MPMTMPEPEVLRLQRSAAPLLVQMYNWNKSSLPLSTLKVELEVQVAPARSFLFPERTKGSTVSRTDAFPVHTPWNEQGD